MRSADHLILPGTGRGTATRIGVVEGLWRERGIRRNRPSTTRFASGPPPRKAGRIEEDHA